MTAAGGGGKVLSRLGILAFTAAAVLLVAGMFVDRPNVAERDRRDADIRSQVEAVVETGEAPELPSDVDAADDDGDTARLLRQSAIGLVALAVLLQLLALIMTPAEADGAAR